MRSPPNEACSSRCAGLDAVVVVCDLEFGVVGWGGRVHMVRPEGGKRERFLKKALHKQAREPAAPFFQSERKNACERKTE